MAPNVTRKNKKIEKCKSAMATRSPWRLAKSYSRLLIIPMLFLSLFFLLPLILVVWRSVSDPSLGIENYHLIFSSSVQITVIRNTIETAFIVAIICLVVSYPIAFILSESEGIKAKIIIALILIPLWTSVVIRSYSWMVIFQRQGVLNEALLSIGITKEAIRFLPSTFANNVGMVHIMLPFMILPLLANMKAIDRGLLRAASVLGANPIQAFVKIFLPLSLPGITAGSALVFMMSLGFYVTPALLGGPRNMMAAVLIEQQANQLLNWGLASAISTLLLLITSIIYIIYIRVSETDLSRQQESN